MCYPMTENELGRLKFLMLPLQTGARSNASRLCLNLEVLGDGTTMKLCVHTLVRLNGRSPDNIPAAPNIPRCILRGLDSKPVRCGAAVAS